MFSLQGQKALIVGIANEHSIAYGCARALRAQGADLAVTWLNGKAEPFVRPLAEQLGAEIMAPLDVGQPGQLEQLFDEVARRWGRLDSLLHSIAFAPKETCTDAWSTARPRGSRKRWTSRSIPSFA